MPGPILLCVWRFPYTKKKFLDVNGMSKNQAQFSSVLTLSTRDTIRFHEQRAQSHGTTLQFRCPQQAQVATCLSDPLATNWKFK